jgi:preprotein translocase subunit SecE
MSKIKAYFEDTYNELFHKVSWPTWSELQSSAIVVMIASVIIAIVVYLLDVSFSNVMKFIYGIFS